MCKKLLAIMAVSPLALACAAPGAWAQDGEGASRDRQYEGAGEDVIVTIGTRRKGRTDTESVIPIDVVGPELIKSSGYVDLNDALRTLVPAFNARRLPLNDGASFVRPITLRSSPADHVLLLMNGKRRHRSATVQIGTGHATTSGSQGQDFNLIPPIAFKSVEVLRDGASAQYGSDAIAGVINMSLKDYREGGSITAHVGQFYAGDGETFDVQANMGFGLTDAGFLNVSAQYVNEAGTSRAGTHVGAAALAEMGITGIPNPPINTGDPKYEALKSVWNAELELSEAATAYLFGNYAWSDSLIGFSYRQSQDAGGLSQHATFFDSIYEGTAAHPEDFDLQAIYPGGYTPKFAGEQSDFSSVVGVKSAGEGPFGWDLSFRYGRNEVNYTLSESINASLGVDSPTTFKPGGLGQREIQVDLELSYALPANMFASDILFFGGASYRNEAYDIIAGDRPSWEVGPLIDLPVGANGFQGFSPDTAGTFVTDSYAFYLEAETDITDQWTLSAAGRYENYEAFGDNFSYKVASRFDFTDWVAVRGAVSTGFRAPAAGQLFGQSQTSQLNGQDFILDAVLVPGSPAAQIFGSTPLVPETSFSTSAGIVFTPGNGFAATLDFYQIDVDDRLLLTDSITVTPAQQAELAALGYPNGASVEEVRFFRNAVDTRVRGFDLVASYEFDWNSNARTNISTSVAYNEQILRSNPGGIIPANKVIEYEDGIPAWRGNLTLNQYFGDFRIMGRGVLYGPWIRAGGLPRDTAILADVEIEYTGLENITIAAGARNVGNKFPPGRGLDALGIIYDNHSVFGTSGGYYYARATYSF